MSSGNIVVDGDEIRVRKAVARFRRMWERERLELYRLHLQVRVRAATPLLAVVASDQDVDVGAALMRLRPPYGWPDARWLHRAVDALALAADRVLHRPRGDIDEMNISRSVAVRTRDDPRGSLILRVAGDTLQVTARLGSVLVRTIGSYAVITFDFALPHILDGALLGRPVGDLIAHPWFEDPDWVIETVVRRTATTVVTVSIGSAPFALPWGRRLRRLEDGCADATRARHLS